MCYVLSILHHGKFPTTLLPLVMWGNYQDLASKSGFSEFSIWALNYYTVVFQKQNPRFQRVNCGNPCKIHMSFGGIDLATLYSVIALVRVKLYSQISLQNVPGTFQDALSIVHNLEPLRDTKTLPAHLQLTSTNFWKIYLFLHKFIVSF